MWIVKFALIASTTYLVIRYQRDLAQARAAEVAALAGHAKARAGITRASGQLLETFGISGNGFATDCEALTQQGAAPCTST